MKLITSRTDMISAALLKVDKNLIIMIASLGLSPSYSDIFVAVKKAFKPLSSIEASINMYSDIATLIRKEFSTIGIDITYSKADSAVINDISFANTNTMKAIRRSYEASISTMIYNGSDNIDRLLIDSISALVIPNSDVIGRSIHSVLNTEVETFVMETDAAIMIRKGNSAGITRYKYIGSLISDSRPWCVRHVGKTFTLDEIDNWGKSSWVGKKSGNPFIERGGWRCRHHFSPVS